jgi:hypothetical protein
MLEQAPVLRRIVKRCVAPGSGILGRTRASAQIAKIDRKIALIVTTT